MGSPHWQLAQACAAFGHADAIQIAASAIGARPRVKKGCMLSPDAARGGRIKKGSRRSGEIDQESEGGPREGGSRSCGVKAATTAVGAAGVDVESVPGVATATLASGGTP